MRVTYITRSFLDYRVPVLESLNKKLGGDFHVIYSADYVPDRVHNRAKKALGEHAIGMRGEKRIGPNEFPDFANTAVRVVYQPGLLREIARTRPDVLVADGFFQWTSFALLYKMRHRRPLVVCYERTFHTERKVQWIRTAYRKLIVRYVDAMSCNGKLSQEYAGSLGMPETRITTGHMVADTENLGRITKRLSGSDLQNLRKEWGDAEVVLLAVGRLNERKGIQELLRGWMLLEKNLPGNWVLGLIGTGPDEESFHELTKKLGLKKVIFHGSIDYNQIAKYYAAADALIMPTLEDNWSLVVPEAMSCGLPILCSRYNGCYPELIEEGKNGWVFDPCDANSTFEALKNCIENRSRLKEMGLRSKEIVALHSPDHAAEAILDACRIATSGKL